MKFKIIQLVDFVILKFVKFVPTAVWNFPLYNTSSLTLCDT
jgi:hypothetical protein